MPKKEEEKVLGLVTEALPNASFRVKLDNDQEIIAYLSGKMRRFKIWILAGDMVKAEFSEYDDNTCRIVYRFK